MNVEGETGRFVRDLVAEYEADAAHEAAKAFLEAAAEPGATELSIRAWGFTFTLTRDANLRAGLVAAGYPESSDFFAIVTSAAFAAFGRTYHALLLSNSPGGSA